MSGVSSRSNLAAGAPAPAAIFRWTEQEITDALAWAEEGYTNASIAGMLNTKHGRKRSAIAVRTMLAHARAKALIGYRSERSERSAAANKATVERKRAEAISRATQRRCLKCQQHFDSLGVGNRVCRPCKSNADWG